MKALIILALLFSACGTNPKDDPNRPRDIDPELWEHVQEFERRFAVTVDIPVRLHAMDEPPAWRGARGVCTNFYSSRKHRSVFVSRAVLREGAASTRWTTWHELGHCMFSLGHVAERYSIMRAEHQADYVAEFGRDPDPYIEHFQGLVP